MGTVATLALLVPGSVGAQGTPPVVAASATGATGPTGPGGVAAPLSATVSSCHADPLQANRYAIFAAQMTSLPARGRWRSNSSSRSATPARSSS